jgi:hypothetical protein
VKCLLIYHTLLPLFFRPSLLQQDAAEAGAPVACSFVRHGSSEVHAPFSWHSFLHAALQAQVSHAAFSEHIMPQPDCFMQPDFFAAAASGADVVKLIPSITTTASSVFMIFLSFPVKRGSTAPAVFRYFTVLIICTSAGQSRSRAPTAFPGESYCARLTLPSFLKQPG